MSRDPARPQTRPTLEPLETRDTPAVQYYGGNLLTSVEAQPVYLGGGWAGNTTPAATDAFLQYVTKSPYMDALQKAGYGVGEGSAAAGVFDPVPLAKGAVITDAAIQAELKADLASGLIKNGPDANRLYVVYVDPNVAVNLGAGQGSTQQGVLGYHGAFAGPGGATVRYAVVAYPGGPAGNTSIGGPAVDQLTAVTSHELAEAVTDPDVNYGRLGWYDPRRGEIGDITEANPNALVRLGGYLVQEVAAPNDQLLVISPPTVPPPPPPPPPPVTQSPPPPPAPAPTTPGATVTSIAVGAVSYHGWYATATVTVTVTPAAGGGSPGGLVGLEVNGQVIGVAALHLKNGVETATFNVAFYANGTYGFSAVYGGGGAYAPSTSGTTPVTV